MVERRCWFKVIFVEETVAGIIAASFTGVGMEAAEHVPELRPAASRSLNLPVQLTTFIGRADEMARVRGLLARNRLVTLTGAGGVGKTRLALEVAATVLAEFPDGVWLVDLSPLTDPGLVPVAVARALSLPDQPGRSAVETVTAFVGTGQALVVLDNCEHMLDACAALAEDLLRGCPALSILATSREPVGAAGEATRRVPSLPVTSEALELFADRARKARPDFAVTADNAEAVEEICRRLDGIPLAIELAAARLRVFSPAEIAAGLHDRFRLLTGGSRTAVRRQQTLRASVDWSHALLTEPERALFRRLAAFSGGFDLAAARAVGAGEGLEAYQVLDQLALLVDKSLVAADESDSQGATRYRLLETVRQYAAEKLGESGEADQVRTQHRDHYAVRASRLDPPAGSGLYADGYSQLISQLEADIDNLRAAFAWSLELSDREAALRLASSLLPMFAGRSRMLEGQAWFDAALDGESVGGDLVAPEVWVRAVADAAVLDRYTDTPQRRKLQAKEAVAVARKLGDPALLGRALNGAGSAAGLLTEEGQASLAEAAGLARDAKDLRTLSQILVFQAVAGVIGGDQVAARSAAEEGLALAERIDNDHLSLHCRVWLGWALLWQGDLNRARSMLSGVVAEAEADRNSQFKMFGLAFLGQASALLGKADQARDAAAASIATAGELGLVGIAQGGHHALALAAMADGNCEALRAVSGATWPTVASEAEHSIMLLVYMAEADLAEGDLPAARQHADQASTSAAKLGLKGNLAAALLSSARAAIAAGDYGRAHDHAQQALAIGRDAHSKILIIDAFECLAAVAPNADDHPKAARLLGAAHALRQETGYQRFRLRQNSYDIAVLALRSALGDQTFDQAWDEGGALALDDAVNYAQRGRGERSRPSIGWLSLTPAELEVVRLVAEGLANKDIAARLFVSPRTVQTHLTHIYDKLGLTSRVQLAQQAARQV
jgi:predicted ATPase/DNA-binding CsgD family transcriptional regulator